MKKFAFLLALVAVFAMSATAFADVKAEVEKIETMDDLSTLNNGAVSTDKSTKLYYVGDDEAKGEVKIGAKFTTGSFTGAANDGIVGFFGTVGKVADTDPAIGATGGGSGSDPVPNGVAYVGTGVFTSDASQVFKDLVKISSIGAYANTNAAVTADTSKGVDLTIVPTVVTISADNVTFDTTATAPTATLVTSAGGADVVIVDKDSDVTFEPDDMTVVASASLSDDLKTIDIKLANPAKAGKVTITVKATDAVTVSEDATNKDIKIAGLEAGGTEVATFTVTVALAPNKSMDKTAYSYRQGTSTDLVISTDIASGDIKYVAIDDVEITKSADILTSADNAGSTTTSPDTKLTIAYAYLDTLKSGDHTIYVGDGAPTTAATTKLASAKLTVIAPEKPDPVYPPAQATPEQKAAVEALVVGSEDLALTTAASHDAVSTAVNTVVPSALSNDVRGYTSINQTVPTSGDYVIIDGAKIPVDPKSGETVTFFKNFGTITEPDRVSLREAMSGDKLEAAILIVDNELPSDVKGAWKSSKDAKKGVVIRKSNGINVVVIYDGNKNGSVVDPIEAHVNRGSSSSSCDMGFGAAVLAGLAVLALRKRSK